MRPIILSLALGLALSGCASSTFVRETNTPSSMRASLGAYNLPGASMQVEIYYALAPDASTDGLIVAAQPPRIVTSDEIPLSARFSAGSEDKISIDRDPATGFLVKASLNLEDKSADTLKAAAASLGAILSLNPSFLVPKAALAGLSGAEAATDVKIQPVYLASAIFDPTDSAQVAVANETLWRQTLDNLQQKRIVDCSSDKKRAHDTARAAALKKAKGDKSVQDPAPDVPSTCTGSPLNTFISSVSAGSLDNQVIATSLAQSRPFIQVPQAALIPNDYIPCVGSKFGNRGLCVRVAREVTVGLQAPGGPISWQGSRLPVKGHEYVIDVERALFVTKTMSVDFTGGFPGKSEISQTSQALAIASLPKDVIDAFIDSLGKTTSALGQLIPLRIDYAKAHAGIADAATTTTTTTTSATPTAATPATGIAAATTPAATTTSTTGASGLTLAAGSSSPPTTITITAAPKTGDDTPKGADADAGGLPKPKLWFTACSLALACQGGVQTQLFPEPAPDIPQPLKNPDAPGGGQLAPVAGVVAPGKVPDPVLAPPAGVGAGKVDCSKAENLASPKCKVAGK